MQVLKKGSMLVVLLSVIGVLFAGCGSSSGGGGGGSTLASSATGSFRLNNSTTSAINEVYVTPSSSSSWGVKQNTNSIPSGSFWTLTGIPIGIWDTRAVIVGSVSTYYSYIWDFPITADTTFAATATNAGFSGTLIVINNSATYSITALYVSPTGYGSGPNQISTSIAPFGSRQIVGIPPGTYYVRAVLNSVNYDVSASIASISYTTFTIN